MNPGATSSDAPTGAARATELMHAVLGVLLDYPAVQDAAPHVLHAISEALELDFAALWLGDDVGAALACSLEWSRDPADALALAAAASRARIESGEEWPGESWRSGKIAVRRDLGSHGRSPRLVAACEAGLRTAYAFPVVADGIVLGVLEGFSGNAGEADAEVIGAVESVGRRVGHELKRERAEQAREKVAARLSTLIRNLHAGTVVEDEKRRIALANQAFCDLFGIPAAPEALIGSDCAAAAEEVKGLFRDPEDFIARTARALERLQPVHAEVLELVDGRILERDYAPVQLGDAVLGNLWTYRDVTAERRAQLENARLRGFYEQVLEAVPAQVGVFDPDGRFLYVNSERIPDADLRRLVIGRTNEECAAELGVPARVAENRSRMIRRVIEERRVAYEEESFEHAGQERWYARFYAPVFDPDGSVVRVVGFGTDLTQTREAQSALAASEARLRGVLESALDCIITIDTDGRVLEFSPAAEQAFGVPREEIQGQGVERLIPERYRAEHARGLKRYLATGEGPLLGQHVEFTALRSDGTEFPVEVAITPVVLGDGREFFTAFLRDITARKQTEAALEEARAAAELSAAAKEQFLATISHELRTPLNAIVGLTHLIERNGAGVDGSSLEGIRYATDTLLTIVNDLLDLSRATSGRVVFESVSFSLRQLLESLVSSTNVTAANRGLSLVLDVAPDVPGTATGDPGRLNQILLNLVGNALKFTERGGVTIRVERTSAEDGSDARTWLRFSVSDTGIGIAEEDLSRIFDPFEQARAETTRRFGGSGLGLAIVRELVQQQGGTIDVQSAVGIGSVFHVTLPFADEGAATDIVQEPEPPASLVGKRLLLVEDNEMNLAIATRILEDAGASVDVARDGGEAVERVRNGRYDLVLMDVQMPVMDGYEATRRIRRELGVPESALPVIALTATAGDQVERRGRASGMTDFVLKPFRPDVLCHRIARALATTEPSRRTAATPPAAPFVDRAVLARNTGGKPDLARQMMEMFASMAPDRLEQLQRAAEAGDCPTVGFLAHQLKAQAGTIGAVGLQEALQALETAARAPDADPETVPAQAQAVVRVAGEVVAELRRAVAEQ